LGFFRAAIGALVVVIAFVAILVERGWAQHPAVSIDFNIGEIIGGALVGLGAPVAGVAYAFDWPSRRDGGTAGGATERPKPNDRSF
jgi:hypothetical protein